jgi:hypothetical protein
VRAGEEVLVLDGTAPGSDFCRVQIVCMYGARCGYGVLRAVRSGGTVELRDCSVEFVIDTELDGSSGLGRVV